MSFTVYQVSTDGSLFNGVHFSTLDELNSWLKSLGQTESTTTKFGNNFQITFKGDQGQFVALSGNGKWFSTICRVY